MDKLKKWDLCCFLVFVQIVFNNLYLITRGQPHLGIFTAVDTGVYDAHCLGLALLHSKLRLSLGHTLLLSKVVLN